MRSQPNTPNERRSSATERSYRPPKASSRWRRARNQNLTASGNAVNPAKVVPVDTTLVVEKALSTQHLARSDRSALIVKDQIKTGIHLAIVDINGTARWLSANR